jgi:serine/threonine protein kinase
MGTDSRQCVRCGKPFRGETSTGTCPACLLKLALDHGDEPRSKGPVLDRDRYESLELIATGGMGAVYKATDLRLDRPVALKVMQAASHTEEDEVRFTEEARITGQLEHPGVVPVHELGEDEQGNVFYTMKHLQGTPLSDILRAIRDGHPQTLERYPLVRLLGIFIKICETVAFAHAKGIIHRDLKPANIMVGDYGEVLVLDWGIAKVLRAGGERSGSGEGPATPRARTETAAPDLTRCGTTMGTPAFMAPEQAAGKIDEIDARTDVYALGCILYNILTLHPPVEGDDVVDILAKVRRGQIADPETWNRPGIKAAQAGGRQEQDPIALLRHMPGRRVPPALAAIAMKALAFSPSDRYASVQALSNDVESYLDQRSVTAMEENLMQALVRLVNRHKGVFITAAAAAVVIVALVATGFWLNLGERRKAEAARDRAMAAQAEAEQARTAAAASEAAVKQVSGQAAPEFVAKAAKALQAQQWEEARAAATTAVGLDPQLGAAWYEKGRVTMQAGDLAAAADCFVSALGDVRIDKDLKARAGRLEMLTRRYARYQQASGKLSMPQCMWLGQTLRGEGETVLAGWFLQLGGKELEAVKAQLAAAEERLKKDNPEVGDIPRAMIGSDEITWDLRGRPKLADLSALHGLPLTGLNLNDTRVADLSPLKGMPLSVLSLVHTPVADLSPLEGTPLQRLSLDGAPVRSLAPLAGAPLEYLSTGAMRLTDLSVLTGMPLRELKINCGARDLSALRDMPLEGLVLADATEVQDFSALATLKNLRFLQTFSAQIRDLSVLKDLPIEQLDLIACPNTLDLGPLRTMTSLKRLNIGQVEARTNISALAGLNIESLIMDRTGVSSLAPLKGMKLKVLDACTWRPIHDYSMLEGMPLESLKVGWLLRSDVNVCLVPDTLGFVKDIKSLKSLQFGLVPADLKAYERVLSVGAALRAANPDYKAGAFYRLVDGQITEVWLEPCAISDLSPLKDLKLTRFAANGVPLTNLTPLAGMALSGVILRNVPVTDLTPLKGMPLVGLHLCDSPVSDLTPVKDAPIEELDLTGSKVTDFSQLKGMSVRRLWIDNKVSDADAAILLSVDSLKQINGDLVRGFMDYGRSQ